MGGTFFKTITSFSLPNTGLSLPRQDYAAISQGGSNSAGGTSAPNGPADVTLQALLPAFRGIFSTPIKYGFWAMGTYPVAAQGAGAKVGAKGKPSSKAKPKKAKTSDQAIVEAGKELRLKVKGGGLKIPAGALPVGVQVSLQVQSVSKSSFSPKKSEQPLTSVMTLKFSEAISAKKVMKLALEIPSRWDGGLYGYIKITGAVPFGEFTGDADWSVEIGRYREKKSLYLFPFYGTAKEISFVVVGREK